MMKLSLGAKSALLYLPVAGIAVLVLWTCLFGGFESSAQDMPVVTAKWQWLRVAGLLSGLVLLGVGTGIPWLLSQCVVKPIAQLEDALAQMAAGSLDTRVNITSSDELGDLGRTFNGMVVSVAERTRLLEVELAERRQAEESLRLARDGLETRVQERLTDLAKVNQALQTEIAEREEMEAAERRQRALAEALRDTASALSSTLNFDEVLDRILVNVERVVPHDIASIMLIESDVARVIKCHSAVKRGLEVSLLGKRLTISQTPDLQTIVQTGRPFVIPDTRADPDWVQIPETYWIRSHITAPIRARGKIVAFLNLDSVTRGFFSLSHAEPLQAFADQAGIAIENARLFDELQASLAITTRLYQLSVQILTASSLQETARLISETLREGFGADATGIRLFDAQGYPEFKYAVGLSPTFYQQAKMRPNGLTFQAWRSGQPVIVSDPELLHLRVRAEGIQSVIALPLIGEINNLGVIYMNYRHVHHSSEHEVQLLSLFANQASLALANVKMREALHSQAIRDPLTDLFNRRYMEETLHRELHRCTRRQAPLGIIMIDIDHFKDVNDRYGHAVGDDLLRAIGAFLPRQFRVEDVVCRYGGEEFVVILPEASLDDTVKRARQLRGAFKQLQVLHRDQPLEPITVSQGVAVFPGDGATAEMVVHAADAALYRAKRRGRDQVAVASGEHP